MFEIIDRAGRDQDFSQTPMKPPAVFKHRGGTRPISRPRAFTLIELLVVIAIIALLASMLFPILRAVNKAKLLHRTKGELAQVETYIEIYKTKLGHYPPDNRSPLDNQLMPGLNQLYYELAGTAMVNGGAYVSKDRTGPALTPVMLSSFFGPGVIGFVNSERGASDEGSGALQLLKSPLPGQVAETTVTNPATKMTVTARVLVCTVPGIDPNNPPLNYGSPSLNPWQYSSSSPTNNPGSYDLWTDILVNGKTLRVCNWSSQPILLK